MEKAAITETHAVRISVAKDFHERPGGRFPWEGANSGEDFRERFLRAGYQQALDHDVMLIVDLDGTSGYASSFLEEAFGGMVRKGYADKIDLLARLVIISDTQPKWKSRVERYIRQS